MKKISTTNAPSAIGPYSQAYLAGKFLFASGQGGLDPADGFVVEGGMESQVEQTMKNLGKYSKKQERILPKRLRQLVFSQICLILLRLMRFMKSIRRKSQPELVLW